MACVWAFLETREKREGIGRKKNWYFVKKFFCVNLYEKKKNLSKKF
jgi:hypothetical protein